MCGFDVPMSACRGDWNGKNLPVLTLAETEEYLTTPQNIIGYLVYKVNYTFLVLVYYFLVLVSILIYCDHLYNKPQFVYFSN